MFQNHQLLMHGQPNFSTKSLKVMKYIFWPQNRGLRKSLLFLLKILVCNPSELYVVCGVASSNLCHTNLI